MGLRSRQRRLAGVPHEESFDVETSKHRTQTLEEHLNASRRGVDDINNSWKHSITTGGLLLSLYEGGLYYQTLIVRGLAPPNASLCLAFKLLSVAAVLVTRQHVQSGSAATFSGSVLLTAAYVALWAAAFWVFALKFTLLQVSPVPIAYFVACHLAMRFIGGNTKAEIARAQQLQKLERAYNQSK